MKNFFGLKIQILLQNLPKIEISISLLQFISTYRIFIFFERVKEKMGMLTSLNNAGLQIFVLFLGLKYIKKFSKPESFPKCGFFLSLLKHGIICLAY